MEVCFIVLKKCFYLHQNYNYIYAVKANARHNAKHTLIESILLSFLEIRNYEAHYNSIALCTLIYVCLWLRFTSHRLKDHNPPRQRAPATSPPRRPPSCPLPQKTRAAVPYHQHHPQFTTRAATAPFRQILMNGTCKYFQKDCRIKTALEIKTQKSAYSRVDLHTHTM